MNLATATETVCKASMSWMAIRRIAQQGLTHPFGDARTVKQAFPAAIDTADADPFLMCDFFDTVEKDGPVQDPDEFPVDWHPHRGFDIASYLKSGTGRHGDSLGNRETFSTPGMQWMSTGSGVVHAEGGASAKGELVEGFQIWINVPANQKMNDPRYGTVPTEQLPLQTIADGVTARVLAGNAFGVKGPFQTVQPVQMIDLEMEPNSKASLQLPTEMDTTMLYLYDGELASLNDHKDHISDGNVVLFDASSEEHRTVQLIAADKVTKALLFAGRKLKEPIAWHGPIVMNTQDQIRQTLMELQSGSFPPLRVDWNYREIASKPKA